jgi:hypothetical protein
MVLSVNENLPPNKAITGQPPPTFLQSNKSWARILRGNVKTSSNGLGSPSSPSTSTQLSDSFTHNKTQPGQFASYSERPFLKGTIPRSILIDITSITNRLRFVHELSANCGGDENLWSVEDIIRRDSNKNFVEITASRAFREELTTVDVSLPSFEKRFFGYPSLSPDSNILQITFSNLPRQYGRSKGGLQELRHDMFANLSRFGTIVDYGTVRGLAGVYSDRGYAVLATNGDSALTHALDWKYRCLFADDAENSAETSVEVYATWDSMSPYCRYCHASDHALADCSKKKSKISCYNCNEIGHMAKSCPRRHSNSSAGRTVHKARKTPSTMSPNAQSTPTETLSVTSPLPTEQLAIPEDPVSAVPTAPAEDRSASLIPGKNISKYAKFTTIMTRSKTGSRPTSTAITSDEHSVPATTGCNSCHRVDHKTYRSTKCVNHWEYLEKTHSTQSDKTVTNISDDEDDSVEESSTEMDPMEEDELSGSSPPRNNL